MISFKTLPFEENEEELLTLLNKLITLTLENKIHYYLNSNICVAVAYYHGVEIRIHDDHVLILGEKSQIRFILGQEFLQKNETLARQLYDAIKSKIKNDRQREIGKIIEIFK